MTREELIQPFDEKAALAELERLRESIQAARKARQRTSDEFDAFIKSFRTPGSTPTPERPMATPLASEAPQPNSESFDDRTALPPAPSPRRYRVNIRSLGILAIIAVIALGLLTTRWRSGAPPPTSVSAVRDNAAVRPNTGASPPAVSRSVPASPAPSRVAIELRVIRPVWMRVVVDGRKDVEGTVQAGEPLHFTGDHSIVVRVGNGGD